MYFDQHTHWYRCLEMIIRVRGGDVIKLVHHNVRKLFGVSVRASKIVNVVWTVSLESLDSRCTSTAFNIVS